MMRVVFRILLGSTLMMFCVAAILCAFQGTAQAYVDPGSGLVLFQSISALFTGVAFFFRRRIRALFSRRPAADVSSPAVENAGDRN